MRPPTKGVGGGRVEIHGGCVRGRCGQTNRLPLRTDTTSDPAPPPAPYHHKHRSSPVFRGNPGPSPPIPGNPHGKAGAGGGADARGGGRGTGSPRGGWPHDGLPVPEDVVDAGA